MASFDILDSTQNAFKNFWEHKELYMRRSSFAIGVHAICIFFFIHSISFKDAETIQAGEVAFEVTRWTTFGVSIAIFVLGLIFLSKLYVFQARFLLTGKVDPIFLSNMSKKKSEEIHHDQEEEPSVGPVEKSYIIGICLVLGVFLLRHFLSEATEMISGSIQVFGDIAVLAFALVYAALLIWMLRLGVMHIPAAINYPLRRFLEVVSGFKFSFCLLGLIIIILVPMICVVAVFASIAIVLSGIIFEPAVNMVTSIVIAIGYVISFLILNGASVYAIDEVMRNAEDNKEDK